MKDGEQPQFTLHPSSESVVTKGACQGTYRATWRVSTSFTRPRSSTPWALDRWSPLIEDVFQSRWGLGLRDDATSKRPQPPPTHASKGEPRALTFEAAQLVIEFKGR